jgi:hypothetical protein
VIGTIVGAYFGLQAGAAGKQKIENQRDHAQAQVRELVGAMDQAQYQKVKGDHRELFASTPSPF